MQQENGTLLMTKIMDNMKGNESDSTIKFEAKVIIPNLCDYSHAYNFVTGDIKVADVAANTNESLKLLKIWI